MALSKQRRPFEEGHQRKFLVIIDDAPEVESAIFFAASRIAHSGGQIVMLYVIEPQSFQHWAGVRQVQLEEETAKAKALFRMFRIKLNQEGFEDIKTEEVIAEGIKSEEIVNLIEEDEDISILILGASTDPNQGPGPLISSLAGGSAGNFPIPMSIVPGTLSIEDLKTLA